MGKVIAPMVNSAMIDASVQPPTSIGRDPAPGLEPPELVIRPRPGWIAIDWAEMVRQRELLYVLTWRDITIRYKQTVLGIAWAVLQPLFTLLIFAVIFGKFAKIPSDGYPYSIYVFAG